MENLLMITFRDARNAAGGLKRLKELDQLGDITIYNYAMLHKTGVNQFVSEEHEGDDTAGLPAVGAIGGSMIGLVGGPFGVLVGMLTGAMVGAADEADDLDFYDEVLEDVKSKINVGDYVIVLDVEEDTEVMINSYIEPIQGVVVRTDVASQFEKYDNEQWDELNKEIDNEEKDLKKAIDKDKASIKAKIEKLKKERDERLKKMKDRSARRKKLLEDKIKTFGDKIKTAEDKTKSKLKAHKKALEENLDEVNKKIDMAFA
ncbi:MAG TPA: DUF1269 domain-containing protein [Puia sp.]|nr:DUF1269 domain-containing protein [Puia sp.]